MKKDTLTYERYSRQIILKEFGVEGQQKLLQSKILVAGAGVLGILPGIIGIMQASETIKMITGIGKALVNVILTYNALSNRMYEIAIVPNENNRLQIPANADVFKQMNYEWLCSPEKEIFEIDTKLFDQLIATKNIDVIDVREAGELPLVKEFVHVQISLSQIKDRISDINSDTIIVFCRSGKRSLQAAQLLSDIFGTSKKIFSLHGGIISWLEKNKTQQT